ncbi:hypothetical protein DBR47_15600 [Paucibacter sp. KBW04]|uniref:DUF2059 domain-containing protein n=1 Tax=Paucibacter sp. KBW04 TaxID=2153361 RepID=UPI000F575BDA|nr:DUF2059 domain-containing protein [Paucibacter sp. KBW04]RQO57254.1 hypothetical protein DBR47_15600 [Paucibacter sp. KBW04]
MRILFALAILFAALNANAAPASQESIEKLLVATKSESLLDSMYGGIEQSMRQTMRQAVIGKQLSSEQQRVLDAVPPKFVAIVREDMNWQKMKPLYVQLYQETFDQEEIDGLLAFYASPTGQAFVNKMPVVMQKSVALSQSLMQSFLPKMMAAIKEAMAEAKVSN